MPFNLHLAKRSALAISLLLVGGPAMAGPIADSRGNPDPHVEDARRESQILTAFHLNPHLRDVGLSVHVDGNKAVLDGVVDSSVSKELADQIAHGADGVKYVDDRIVVDETFVAPLRAPSVRTFAEILDDATIAASVKYKLIWNNKTDALAINVDASNGQVTLAGAVRTLPEKTLAGRIARDTKGVISVTNNLAVAQATGAAVEARSAIVAANAERPSDAWITAKVKSSLMFTRGADVFRITVNTRDGVVSLAGVVDTVAERDRMVEVTGDVRGVKSVDSKGLKAG